jgi:hypothetical protein
VRRAYIDDIDIPFFWGCVARLFGHDLGRRDATRWIASRLRPSQRKYPIGCAAIKAEWERQSIRSLPYSQLVKLLVDAGFTVGRDGDTLFAEDQ